tara:strand:- start:595 stop:1092 length:498 start_codon:yes stop_codon:yes gene_type:complete
MEDKLRNKVVIGLIILGVIGLVTSTYLTFLHYNPGGDLGFCLVDENGVSSCTIVNSSSFSEVLGIPAGVLGMVWFAILFVLLWQVKKRQELAKRLLIWNVLGVLSIFYFIYGEIVLGTICTYCTVVHVIVVISLIVSIFFMKELKNQKKDEEVNQDGKKSGKKSN